MIPPVLHYCWFGGQPLSPLAEACLASWNRHFSDGEIKRWDESTIPVDDHAYMREARKRGLWAFIADYARLMVLIEEGGIYLDTDMEMVRPFTPLLDNELFVADERPGRMNGAVIGATRNSPFLKACLEWMDRDAAKGKPSFTPIPNIMQAVYEAGDYNVSVYPPRYFYPYNPYDREQPVKQLLYSDVTEDTYAIHHWSASWVRPRSWKQYIKSVALHAYRNLPRR